MPTRHGESDPTRCKKKQKKTRKRKRNVTEEDDELRKSARLDLFESETKAEECSPWNNLDLVLSLQDKNTDVTKKIDLAFDHVKSRDCGKMDVTSQCLQVLNTSRTVIFLNNWVQSILISSEKKTRFEEYKPECHSSESVLDVKCWKILHFCLKESQKTSLRLTFTKDFLRVINYIVMDASSCIKDISLYSKRILSVTRMELYIVILDCISLVLSSHGGIANVNLDLWILLMHGVIDNVIKIITSQLDESKLVTFVLQLSLYLLEPFANFLRLHPTRKSGFHDFIDKLLEPMLQSLHVLNSSSPGHHAELKTNLIKLIEEVLSQGLFHPTHIDGFLDLQSTSKYRNSSDTVVQEKISVNRSYHRHFFDVVEKIIAKKNDLALVSLGELLHLFVICAMKHKEASTSGEGSRKPELFSVSVNDTSRRRTTISTGFPNVDTELRKNIFDFFVQIMEYLMIDVNKYLRTNGEGISVLPDVPSKLRSINSLLAVYVHDKLYLRTEDNSEGACQNFLQIVYDVFTSLSGKISALNVSTLGSDEEHLREILNSVKLEIVVGVGHLLDMEYEVVGSGLESIWTIVFSSMACSRTSANVVGQPLLFSQIIRLSCQLIDLYSELRQVNSCIFALCRAVRNSVSYLLDSEICNPSHRSSYLNSLSMLICSLEFRKTLSKAAMAIPEGQVAECIRLLNAESLDQIKSGHQLTSINESSKSNPHSRDSQRFHLQVELLGRVLSEVYSVLLKSTTLTSGNSYLVGVALKNLIDILQPILSGLVSLQPHNELSVVIGERILSKSTGCGNLPMCWFLVFCFQLLCDCRSIMYQAISLMPPDSSEKMSGVISNSFIAYSGHKLLKMAEYADKGYFSWIVQPSETLLNVLHSISDLCIQDSVVTFAPLVYICNVMAIQRLVDLNHLIKALQSKVLMRKEAADLTKFIMVCLSYVAKDLISSPSGDGIIDSSVIQHMHYTDGIDIYVGPLDEKLLPSALWCIICRSTDIWWSHASKGDLKKFLRLLTRAFCIALGNQGGHFKMHSVRGVHYLDVATKFLNDMKLYDQEFLYRHMAPRICRMLQKSVTSIFSDNGGDLSKSPNWVKVLSAIKSLSDVEIGASLKVRAGMPSEPCDERKANVEISTCKHLLSLFMKMPKVYFAVGSKSLSINYILNLERVLLGSLLGWYGARCSHNTYCEIFLLYTTCRRVLKIFCEVNANGSLFPLASNLPECLFLPWLLTSLYALIGLRKSFRGDNISEEKDAIFSLINNTSDVLLTISRYHFECTNRKPNVKGKNIESSSEESDVSDGNLQLSPRGNLNAFQNVLQLIEALRDDMQISVTTFQNEFSNNRKECLAGQELNKLSSMVACFQGLLSGLASSFSNTDAVSNNLKISFLTNNTDLINRINSCIVAFANFTIFFMNTFFLEDDSTLALASCDGFDDVSNQSQLPPRGNSPPLEIKDGLKKGILKTKCHSAVSELEALLINAQRMNRRQRKLLLQIIKGENAEAAFLLHHLFIAFAVILRIYLVLPVSSTSCSLYPDLVDISRFLLLGFSTSVTPFQCGYIWLNGVAKFLKEIGEYFANFDPSTSGDLYVDFVDLHITAIGKCISLQRKEARLASQWTGSTAKMQANETKSCLDSRIAELAELQDTLRLSFRPYFVEPSMLHLRSTLQAVERALVGLQVGSMTNYEITCGHFGGGEVSLVVAGGIDCLALILEDVKGRKRLNMIEKHVQGFVACLFNVIVHLQGPNIFYGHVDSVNDSIHPDSGSVILMCVEVLTRIYGKASRFRIEASHVAQSLRVPGALFQYFLQLQISEASTKSASVVTTTSSWKLSVELYNACCCLLSAALKHHQSETLQFMALLDNSVGILLHCLENVNTDPVSRSDMFSWDLRDAVTCAISLRRVYEEVRQQKDVFGEYSHQFLSRYIRIYCGFGPSKKGIIREIDDELKPGIHALLDTCSADNLQLLHTMFGEGPCRSTLAALQHDYRVNFKYSGKV